MLRQSPTRTVAPTSALAEFHVLSGHAGMPDGCGLCADQLQRQRQAASALRTHQRHARQRVDAVIDEDPGDEQQELRRDAEQDDLGPEDLSEPWERWGW